MPVPEGIISTSTGPVDPTEVVEVSTTEEELVQDDLPELP